MVSFQSCRSQPTYSCRQTHQTHRNRQVHWRFDKNWNHIALEHSKILRLLKSSKDEITQCLHLTQQLTIHAILRMHTQKTDLTYIYIYIYVIHTNIGTYTYNTRDHTQYIILYLRQFEHKYAYENFKLKLNETMRMGEIDILKKYYTHNHPSLSIQLNVVISILSVS